MIKYYMFNFEETKSFLIGEFESYAAFWKHYFNNETEIKRKQRNLDANSSWHMWHIGSTEL